MIENSERISFLKNIELFRGLEDDEFRLVAESAEEVDIPKGDVIFEKGTEAEGFYMIYYGKFIVTNRQFPNKRRHAILKKYDYFGHTDLVMNRWRSSTVTALTNGKLLAISRSKFRLLYPEISTLRRKRIQRLLLVVIPETIGRFALDILGRDKASATTALILGWLLILGIILFATGVIPSSLFSDTWKSFLLKTP